MVQGPRAPARLHGLRGDRKKPLQQRPSGARLRAHQSLRTPAQPRRRQDMGKARSRRRERFPSPRDGLEHERRVRMEPGAQLADETAPPASRTKRSPESRERNTPPEVAAAAYFSRVIRASASFGLQAAPKGCPCTSI